MSIWNTYMRSDQHTQHLCFESVWSKMLFSCLTRVRTGTITLLSHFVFVFLSVQNEKYTTFCRTANSLINLWAENCILLGTYWNIKRRIVIPVGSHLQNMNMRSRIWNRSPRHEIKGPQAPAITAARFPKSPVLKTLGAHNQRLVPRLAQTPAPSLWCGDPHGSVCWKPAHCWPQARGCPEDAGLLWKPGPGSTLPSLSALPRRSGLMLLLPVCLPQQGKISACGQCCLKSAHRPSKLQGARLFPKLRLQYQMLNMARN